jgi:hypothetical protein
MKKTSALIWVVLVLVIILVVYLIGQQSRTIKEFSVSPKDGVHFTFEQYKDVPHEELVQRQDELHTRLHKAQEDFSQTRQTEPPNQYPIAGLWRAANGFSYTIVQTGNYITIQEENPVFGVTAVGWGVIAGQQINIKWLNARSLSGKADLRVSYDSRQIKGAFSLENGQTGYLLLFR